MTKQLPTVALFSAAEGKIDLIMREKRRLTCVASNATVSGLPSILEDGKVARVRLTEERHETPPRVFSPAPLLGGREQKLMPARRLGPENPAGFRTDPRQRRTRRGSRLRA